MGSIFACFLSSPDQHGLQFGKTSDDRSGVNDCSIGRRVWLEAINHGLKFLHVANHDFHQETIFPGDAIRFNDLGRIDKHLGQSSDFAGHGAYSHMRSNTKTEGFGINHNRISTDCAGIFQFVDALCYAGAGQANLSCKLADGHSTVFGQRGNYGSIGRVEGPGNVTASIHC